MIKPGDLIQFPGWLMTFNPHGKYYWCLVLSVDYSSINFFSLSEFYEYSLTLETLYNLMYEDATTTNEIKVFSI